MHGNQQNVSTQTDQNTQQQNVSKSPTIGDGFKKIPWWGIGATLISSFLITAIIYKSINNQSNDKVNDTDNIESNKVESDTLDMIKDPVFIVGALLLFLLTILLASRYFQNDLEKNWKKTEEQQKQEQQKQEQQKQEQQKQEQHKKEQHKKEQSDEVTQNSQQIQSIEADLRQVKQQLGSFQQYQDSVKMDINSIKTQQLQQQQERMLSPQQPPIQPQQQIQSVQPQPQQPPYYTPPVGGWRYY